jgi:AcrR family transcriptional regulator
MMTAAKARSTKTAYHHGDLRTALVAVGCELIENHGIAALTLRRVSALLNVSQTASAHHFGDKEGLEAAIATECFRRLTANLIKIRNVAAEPELGLLNMLHGYLQFSKEFPAGFELMFGARLARNPRHNELLAASLICYELLHDAVHSALPHHVKDKQNLHDATYAAWSLIHGMASIDAGFGLPSQVRNAQPVDRIQSNVLKSFVRNLGCYGL